MAPHGLPEIEFWEVPRCWPGGTVAILAGGASLKQRDVDRLRGRCRVIALNRAGVGKPDGYVGRWISAPWADWLYAGDAGFWHAHPRAVAFAGLKVAMLPSSRLRSAWSRLVPLAAAGVKVLRHTACDYPVPRPCNEGLSDDRRVVRGNNSAFQVLSVVHFTGARIVLLLGLDLGGPHWHGGYPDAPDVDYGRDLVPKFASLVEPLRAAGVAVLNCSRRSRLRCWPRVQVSDVL